MGDLTDAREETAHLRALLREAKEGRLRLEIIAAHLAEHVKAHRLRDPGRPDDPPELCAPVEGCRPCDAVRAWEEYETDE